MKRLSFILTISLLIVSIAMQAQSISEYLQTVLPEMEAEAPIDTVKYYETNNL